MWWVASTAPLPSPFLCSTAAKRWGLVYTSTGDTVPSVTGSLHVAKVHNFAALMANRDHSPMHGDCISPVMLEYRGKRDELLHRLERWQEDKALDYAPGWGMIGGEWGPAFATTAYLSVRCRKCSACLKQRAKVWATRGQLELVAAKRSWFGTLTVRPEERFRARLRADAACDKRGVRWSDLSDSEQFAEIAKVLRGDFQRYLKRVRKASRARIRYCMTTEAHADGFPHLHLLLHEYQGATTKRLLEEQWPLGISHWRLVNGLDHKVPWYVAKYLTKSILAKPVASLRYGRPPLAVLSEAVADAAGECRGKPNPVKEEMGG